MSTQPTTYRTAGGAVITLGFRRNAFGQPTHTFECGGCDGFRGYKTAAQADTGAQNHAARCTGQALGGAR